MGIAVWAVDYLLSRSLSTTTGGHLTRVIVGLVVAALVFLLAAKLAKMRELAEITDMLRTVLKRKAQQAAGPGLQG